MRSAQFGIFGVTLLLLLGSLGMKADSDTSGIRYSSYDADPTNKNQKNNVAFVRHLMNIGEYDDALYLLDEMAESGDVSIAEDTVTFYRGWIHYFRQEFLESAILLNHVDSASNLYSYAQLYRAVCLVEQDKDDSASYIVNHLEPSAGDEVFQIVKYMQSSLALLDRDTSSYKALQNEYNAESVILGAEQKDLENLFQGIREFKHKSPFVAGLLSALVPGLGKLYAGYVGLPFGILSQTLPPAVLATEALIISGVSSLPFIGFASLFGVFYISQIWGSALSVKAYRIEYFDEVDHNIVLNMHIPLRRLYTP